MQRNESLDNFWNRADTYQYSQQQVSRNTNMNRNLYNTSYDTSYNTSYENSYNQSARNTDYKNTSYKNTGYKNTSYKNTSYKNTNNSRALYDADPMTDYYNTSNSYNNSQSLYDTIPPYNRSHTLNNTAAISGMYAQPQKRADIIPMPMERNTAPMPFDNSGFDEDSSGDVSNWIVTLLLIAIPFVNVILLIKWALSNKDPRRQSFARAFLFSSLVLITISLVMLNLFYDKFDPLSKIETIKNVASNMLSNMK